MRKLTNLIGDILIKYKKLKAQDDIEEVIPEVMDLDASEWNELVDYVQANFDLDTDPEDDTDVETKIEEALNAGVELLRLTQVIK